MAINLIKSVHKSILLGWVTLLLAGYGAQLSAQSPVVTSSYADSLKLAVSKAKTDSSKVETLFLLTDFYSDKDTAQALKYIDQANRYAKKNPYQAARFHFYRAGIYFDSDIAKSQTGYLISERLLRKFPGKEALIYRSRAWHNYGALQQRKDDEKAYAQIIIDHAIPLAMQAGDSARVARNYQNLGLIFSNQLDYPKAEKYLSSAVSILERIGPKSLELADAYIFSAKNLIYQKKYAPVGPLLIKARAILSDDPGSSYFTEFYMVEGMYYSRLRQYPKAMESFDMGIALAKKLGQTYEASGIMLQKYFTYKAQGNYPKAIEIIKNLIYEKPAVARHKNRLLYYQELSQLSAKTGDISQAYRWLLKYTELADSTHQQRVRTDIAALEARYKSAEREKEIDRLHAKNEKAALTIKNNRLINWFLAVGCLLFLTVTILVLLFYRNNKRLLDQQQQLHALDLQKIKQDHRIAMLSAMLQGQEQERTRLARDLHDGLGGLLSSIKIELSQVGRRPQQQILSGIDNTLSHLDGAVDELRRIARSLMPEILMKYGLAEAAREFCKNLKKTGVNIVCQVFNYQGPLSQEKQVVVYRIIQELVTNALKHAAASQILVIIQQSDQTLFVTVEDDGIGFESSETAAIAGAGLYNVRARAEFLNARFDLQSAPGKGTSVTIECDI